MTKISISDDTSTFASPIGKRVWGSSLFFFLPEIHTIQSIMSRPNTRNEDLSQARALPSQAVRQGKTQWWGKVRQGKARQDKAQQGSRPLRATGGPPTRPLLAPYTGVPTPFKNRLIRGPCYINPTCRHAEQLHTDFIHSRATESVTTTTIQQQ